MNKSYQTYTILKEQVVCYDDDFIKSYTTNMT